MNKIKEGSLVKACKDNIEDSRKLLTDVDIRKIQEKAIKDAITYSAFRDDHQWSSHKAYEIMTKYAEKLGRGEV